MADYSSVFSGTGPTFNPSSFGGTYSPVFSASGPVFNPGSFTGGYDFSPSVSYKEPTAKKSGFDWKALIMGLGEATPAIERAILRMRGFPESSIGYSSRSPRMAGSELAAFLKSQADQGSDSLAKTLEAAASGMIGDFSDFDPSKTFSL